jgi:hypothetical protein
MMGDGVGADVHAGGDLVVVQSLGDQAGDGLLGAGQAVPPGDRPGGGRGPVAAADAELAQPAPDAGLVAVGAGPRLWAAAATIRAPSTGSSGQCPGSGLGNRTENCGPEQAALDDVEDVCVSVTYLAPDQAPALVRELDSWRYSRLERLPP